MHVTDIRRQPSCLHVCGLSTPTCFRFFLKEIVPTSLPPNSPASGCPLVHQSPFEPVVARMGSWRVQTVVCAVPKMAEPTPLLEFSEHSKALPSRVHGWDTLKHPTGQGPWGHRCTLTFVFFPSRTLSSGICNACPITQVAHMIERPLFRSPKVSFIHFKT